ncbi:putative ascorbate ferrireductase (transmembrane) [Helianthus annuus]|nr:putative ascorbate ferrireductase (transmembrane) [Helianthus annuus]
MCVCVFESPPPPPPHLFQPLTPVKGLANTTLAPLGWCTGALKISFGKGRETTTWGAGFATFWYPGGSRNSRASLLPWHVFFGVYIYVLAVAACVTGLLEKATFLQTNNVISRYSAEAMLVNILGVSIVFLGGFVILGIISPPTGKGDVLRGSVE